MRFSKARQMALGGVLAALAVLIQSMGTLIPVATFVCPLLCTILLAVVLELCGRTTAWTWYAAVAILGLLLAADKEAAAVFIFLGYYPIVKPWLDRRPLRVLWKILLFNGVTLLMYALLMNVFGMDQIREEFQQMGWVLGGVTLLLGNGVFFLLDKLLNLLGQTFRRGKR